MGPMRKQPCAFVLEESLNCCECNTWWLDLIFRVSYVEQKSRNHNQIPPDDSQLEQRRSMWKKRPAQAFCLLPSAFSLNEALWCFYGVTWCTSLLGVSAAAHTALCARRSPCLVSLGAHLHSSYFSCVCIHFACLIVTPAVCRCCLRWYNSDAQWLPRRPVPSRQVDSLTVPSFYLVALSSILHWYYIIFFKTGSADRIQVRCWHTKHNCCQTVLKKMLLVSFPSSVFLPALRWRGSPLQKWGAWLSFSSLRTTLGEPPLPHTHSSDRYSFQSTEPTRLLCIFCVLSQHLLKWLLEGLTERVGSGNQLHLQGSVWVSGRGLLASRSLCVQCLPDCRSACLSPVQC